MKIGINITHDGTVWEAEVMHDSLEYEDTTTHHSVADPTLGGLFNRVEDYLKTTLRNAAVVIGYEGPQE